MDEQTNYFMSICLDTETKFNYLNYYCQKMLDETNDKECVYKLECLYEWWQQESVIPDGYDGECYNPYDYDSD